MTMFCPLVDCCCEWVCVVLLMMGCCVGCAWRCCYELCGCMNCASPVGFVLSLFYLCAFQMNPVCVWLHLIEVCCLFVTKVINPNEWSECVGVFACVCRRTRI